MNTQIKTHIVHYQSEYEPWQGITSETMIDAIKNGFINCNPASRKVTGIGEERWEYDDHLGIIEQIPLHRIFYVDILKEF